MRCLSSRRLSFAIAACSAAFLLPTAASAVLVGITNTYHAQETNVYCGLASMQMILDSSGVTVPLPTQAQMRAFSQPRNVVPMSGTDPIACQATLNNYDGVAHGYSWYGFVPTSYARNIACRTLANALNDYKVPAMVAVNNGQHWINAYDVDYTGSITPDPITHKRNYKINGFWTRDPWTGYADSKNLRQKGLGYNTWLRYGGDLRNAQNEVERGFFKVFTPTYLQGGLPYGNQYVEVLDPQGPELPDDGTFDSEPTPLPELPEINQPTAVADAIADLAANSEFNSKPGFENGSFDANAADDILLQEAGDTGTEGDFLVPYDGTGGVNDVTGFFLIDADTGVVDQATLLDAGMPHWSLAEVQQMFSQESTGDLPADDLVATLPEPTLLLSAAGAITLIGRRSRRATR